MVLNNPYYIYPGYPFAGYNDIENYNPELIRLNEYINELKSTIGRKVLVHLTLGTAAEELSKEKRIDVRFQWQQMLPEHIHTLLKNNTEMSIIHIVVSPCNFFKDGDYNPLFTKKAPEFEWYMDEKNTFRSRKYANYVTKIFYCPMPSSYDYSGLIKKMNSEPLIFNKDMIAKIEQTNDDKFFIDMFYYNMHQLFNIVNSYNGYVSCFSYAVFNADTIKASFSDYYLFREIKELFMDDYETSNRILAEWVYRVETFVMIIHNTRSTKKFFSYISPFLLSKSTLKSDNIQYLTINKDVHINDMMKLVEFTPSIMSNKIEITDSLYKCLGITNNEKIKQMKQIIVNNIKDKWLSGLIDIDDYIEKHDVYSNIFTIDTYLEYLLNLSDSNIGISIRRMLNVPINSHIIDKNEINELSLILKKNIIIINNNGDELYSADYKYHDSEVIVYDKKTMKYGNFIL